MNRCAALVIAAALLVALLTAPASAGNWTGGLKAGLNVADAYGDDAEGAGSRVGLIAGGFFGYRFTDYFTIQHEILFSMKGSEGSHMNFFGGDRNVMIRLAYLEVPVLARFTVPLAGRWKPGIFAGPAFSLLVYDNAEYEMYGKTVDMDIDEYIKSADIGFVFGMCLECDQGRGRTLVDIRYELGMINVPDDTEYMDLELKNSTLSIMIGYAFR